MHVHGWNLERKPSSQGKQDHGQSGWWLHDTLRAHPTSGTFRVHQDLQAHEVRRSQNI